MANVASPEPTSGELSGQEGVENVPSPGERAMIAALLEKWRGEGPDGSADDLGITPLVEHVIESLIQRTGVPGEELLVRALGVYTIALNGGRRVAVVDDDWEVVSEITGIATTREPSGAS